MEPASPTHQLACQSAVFHGFGLVGADRGTRPTTNLCARSPSWLPNPCRKYALCGVGREHAHLGTWDVWTLWRCSDALTLCDPNLYMVAVDARSTVSVVLSLLLRLLRDKLIDDWRQRRTWRNVIWWLNLGADPGELLNLSQTKCTVPGEHLGRYSHIPLISKRFSQ